MEWRGGESYHDQTCREALEGDLLVFLHPHKDVTREFRDDVARYVEAGGKVLVIDSPRNAGSTANSILWPYGLSFGRAAGLSGELRVPEGWPQVSVGSAVHVSGGEPFIHLQGRPIAAVARHGKGLVIAAGLGGRFNDREMGVIGDVIPDARLRPVFDLEFTLLRAIVSGEALSARLSISRDFEMSQFWQNLQPRLQPAVPNERTGEPGRKWLSGFFSIGSTQNPDERP